MRDFQGLNAGAIPSTLDKVEAWLPTLRRDMVDLDYFLRDLSRGISRIQKGQIPDGSGDPIPFTDDGFFFKLPGRPANQDAHGGTLAGGSLTLSSTAHTTRGLIYFGDAKTSVYDETNDRFGVNATAPAAKLQLNTNTPAQVLRATSLRSNSGTPWVDQVGSSVGADLVVAVNDSSNTTYVRHGRTLGTVAFELANGTDPGVNTGHVISITARVNSQNGNDHLIFALSEGGSTIVSLNIPSNGGSPTSFPDDVQLPLTFGTYTYTLTAGEAAAIVDYTNLNLNWTYYTGFDAATFVDVSECSLTLPGATAEPLQRWSQNLTDQVNNLAWALDGNGATVLAFTGTPKLAFQNTGLEFTIGSPASGKFWTAADTVGTGQWSTISASTFPHVILDSTVHTDTLTGTVVRGDIIRGNSTPAWSRLAVGAATFFLKSDGTDPAWTSGAALTKTDDTNVTLTLGGSATTALVNAASLTLGWTGTLGVTRGGTGFGTATAGDIIYGSAANVFSKLAIGNQRRVLQVSGANLPTWSGVLFPTTLNTGDLLYAQATSDVAGLSDIAVGNVLLSGGLLTAPSWGKVDLTAHITGDLPFANLTQGSARSVLGVTGNATADFASIQGTASQFLQVNSAGTALTFATLTAAMLPSHDHSSATQGGLTVNLQDTTFTVFKSTSPTSKFRFDAAGLTVVGTYVFGWPTSPPSPATIALWEASNMWTGANDFTVGAVSVTDTFFYVLKSTDLSKSMQFSLAGLSAARVYTAPNAAGTLALTSDAGGSIDVARTWATLQTFKDTTFKVVDDGDSSKTLVFSLGGATANADLILAWAGTVDRTITFPDAAGTIALTSDASGSIDVARTWATLQTFKDTTFTVGDDGDTTKNVVWSLGGATSARTLTLISSHTANRSITFPNFTATLAHLGNTPQTFAGAMTFNGAFTSTAGGTYSGSGTVTFQLGGGVQIADNSSASGPFIFATASAANNANFTLPDLPNNSTFVLKTGTDANATSGAGAAIGSTNFAATPNAGLYAIFWDLYVTTAGTSGTVTVTFSWTDDIGATSWTSNTLALGPATGRYPVGTNQPIVFRVASGAVSYNTTVAAVVGSPVHKIYARLVAL